MAISYKIIERINPQNVTAPKKYDAAVKTNGSIDFESLAALISQQCTVTETDCLAVLNVLEQNIERELGQGRIVRLGKLGNFQVSLSSEGFDTSAEVSAAGITNSRIIFRPARKLRKLLKNLTYSKAS